MLVSSEFVHRMFGANSVLIAAKNLLPLPGVDVIEDNAPDDYWHFLCDRHEIVVANGAPAETLYLGEQALGNMTQDARDEIHTLFPQLLKDWEAPRVAEFACGKRSKQMVARHLKNASSIAAAQPTASQDGPAAREPNAARH